MKRRIHFDNEKYQAIEKTVIRLVKSLNEFIVEYNNSACEKTKIRTQNDFESALVGSDSYVKNCILEGESFEISGKSLSSDKALELGLWKMPEHSGKLRSISEKYWKLTGGSLNSFSPFQFDKRNFILKDGEIEIDEDFSNSMKEQCSFYLNPDKKEEYETLERLVACLDKEIPEHSGNDWDRINKYVYKKMCLVHNGKNFRIMPDYKEFSN